jgi:phage terminase large subunit-like protein
MKRAPTTPTGPQNAATCARCGGPMPPFAGMGRPRRHCERCRKPRTVTRTVTPVAVTLTVTPGSGPFTVEHFRAWASELELDNGEMWVLEDFQAAFIAEVFTGVPEAWLIIPEGNGKTTLMAGLALYHSEFKRTASVKVAASATDQAQILFGQAEGMVDRSDRLTKMFRCLPGYRRIECAEMNSVIQVLSADDKTGDGVIPTLCILDELHRHRDLRLYRTWRGKLGKRKGQIVAISTAGEPGSEFENARESIRQQSVVVERGETFLRAVSTHLVLHEYAVPEDGDVTDMALVKRANPFSGVTVEALTEKFETPTQSMPHWRRFVCNLPTRSDMAAITEFEWAAAKTTEKIPRGEPVWVGLDVAWKLDTTAIVPLWWRGEEDRILGPATVLTPPRDGNSLDYKLIEQAFRDIHARNPIHTVVMDPTKAEQLGGWLEDTFECRIVERGATNPAAQADYASFMEALRLGWLRHQGDEDLTTHALNAVAQLLPGGGARFARPVMSRRAASLQDQRVIDALIAAAMVHSVATVEEMAGERMPLVAFI